MNQIYYTSLGEQCVLDIKDVMFFKADQSYVDAYLSDGSVVILAKSLVALNRIVPSGEFFRVHRSYLVRVSLMRSVERVFGTANSKGLNIYGYPDMIPIGRRKVKEVKDIVTTNRTNK